MKHTKRILLILLILASLFSTLAGTGVNAEEPSTRWADAADEIDRYLDAAFEYYLEGDAKAAYDSVSNAYFRVYETTGFERQTILGIVLLVTFLVAHYRGKMDPRDQMEAPAPRRALP